MEQRVNLEKLLVGQKMEPRYIEYNWRDIVLYALAVGAKKDDLHYIYEKYLKAIPSYGVIPYWGALGVKPYQWMPLPASMLANDIIQPTISYLNMDHELIQACVKAHDVAFLNLESTFHDREGIPSALSGGTWAMSDPRILDDMKEYGFNLFNTANNHSCDYSQSGVLATIEHLKKRDMIFAGTGKDLGDASKACYVDTKYARVAMLACNSSGNDSARAGAQTEDLPGRPGANPMRCLKRFHVDQAHFDMVKELAEINGDQHLHRFAAIGIGNLFVLDLIDGLHHHGGQKDRYGGAVGLGHLPNLVGL